MTDPDTARCGQQGGPRCVRYAGGAPGVDLQRQVTNSGGSYRPGQAGGAVWTLRCPTRVGCQNAVCDQCSGIRSRLAALQCCRQVPSEMNQSRPLAPSLNAVEALSGSPVSDPADRPRDATLSWQYGRGVPELRAIGAAVGSNTTNRLAVVTTVRQDELDVSVRCPMFKVAITRWICVDRVFRDCGASLPRSKLWDGGEAIRVELARGLI